jgi:hypothetical protein
METDAMLGRLVPVLLLLGCAAGGAPAPSPEAAVDSDQVDETVSRTCLREATVTVHVENRSGSDIAIAFGTYAPVRAAPALSRTTYRVPRNYLEDYIRLRIAGGGLAVSTPPPVATEFVVCSDATLIIGPRPRYSFFYGDLIRQLEPRRKDDEPPDTTTTGS